jgi:hypothetical protein
VRLPFRRPCLRAARGSPGQSEHFFAADAKALW